MKNAMTPRTIDTVKVSTALVQTAAQRTAAAESLLTSLQRINAQGDNLQALRADLAVSVWNLRLCYPFVGTDKVRRPDYNGQSGPYQEAYRALMVKAGFAITEAMTPFQQHSMSVAKKQVASAIRYEVRKLADRTLTASQLRAAGFHWSSALGDDQKLSEELDAAPKPTPKLQSVAVNLSNAVTELEAAIARPQDVRDLVASERQDLLKRLSAVFGPVAILLGATPPARRTVPRKGASTPRPRKEVSTKA